MLQGGGATLYLGYDLFLIKSLSSIRHNIFLRSQFLFHRLGDDNVLQNKSFFRICIYWEINPFFPGDNIF
jgi:hypothetical protein